MLTRRRVNFVTLPAQVSITGDSVRVVIHSWKTNSGIPASHCRDGYWLEINKGSFVAGLSGWDNWPRHDGVSSLRGRSGEGQKAISP